MPAMSGGGAQGQRREGSSSQGPGAGFSRELVSEHRASASAGRGGGLFRDVGCAGG